MCSDYFFLDFLSLTLCGLSSFFFLVVLSLWGFLPMSEGALFLFPLRLCDVRVIRFSLRFLPVLSFFAWCPLTSGLVVRLARMGALLLSERGLRFVRWFSSG